MVPPIFLLPAHCHRPMVLQPWERKRNLDSKSINEETHIAFRTKGGGNQSFDEHSG
jgi:hypothetical protein